MAGTNSFDTPKGNAPELESLTEALMHKRQVISESMDPSLKTKDESKDKSQDA